ARPVASLTASTRFSAFPTVWRSSFFMGSTRHGLHGDTETRRTAIAALSRRDSFISSTRHSAGRRALSPCLRVSVVAFAGAGGLEDGFDRLDVPRAAAEAAGQGVADLLLGRPGAGVQE